VAHACNPSSLEADIGGSQFKASSDKKKLEKPCLKEQAWRGGAHL
jgi:hypothetical protein